MNSEVSRDSLCEQQHYLVSNQRFGRLHRCQLSEVFEEPHVNKTKGHHAFEVQNATFVVASISEILDVFRIPMFKHLFRLAAIFVRFIKSGGPRFQVTWINFMDVF